MFVSHEDMIAIDDSSIKGSDAKVGVWSMTAQSFLKRPRKTVGMSFYRLVL